MLWGSDFGKAFIGWLALSYPAEADSKPSNVASDPIYDGNRK